MQRAVSLQHSSYDKMDQDDIDEQMKLVASHHLEELKKRNQKTRIAPEAKTQSINVYTCKQLDYLIRKQEILTSRIDHLKKL